MSDIVTTDDTSSITSLSNHPIARQISEKQLAEGNTTSLEGTKDQGKEISEFAATKASAGDEDDDVLFVFSAPRSKKQKRRFGSLHAPPVFNQHYEPPSRQSNPPLDFCTRRGTTGMVQGLEGCHIKDMDSKSSQIRGASLPTAPPAVQQIPGLGLPSIDPTTEPNFAAMQDIPFPDSCLQWWNEPESVFRSEQTYGWMDFQHCETPSSEQNRGEASSEERVDSVDEQISPRTKPATTFQTNNAPKDYRTDARGLAKTLNDQMRFQPPSYSSTPMPSWSKNWCAFSDAGNAHFPRPRMPSSTPLSVLRNTFGSNVQQGNQVHMYGQVGRYPPQHGDRPRGYISGRLNHQYEQNPHNSGFVSMDSARDLGERITQGFKPPGMITPSLQQQHITSPNQSPGLFQTSSHFINGDSFCSTQQSSSRTDNPNDILRKPSLYKIPPWSSLTSPGVSVPSSSYVSGPHNITQGAVAQGQINRQNNSDHVHSTLTPPPVQQTPPTSNLEPTSRRRGARKYSPNLIVDIAETCQQLLPYELLAERHSVPLQKVYDTFSAIIQLPLLRNADDKRRHGSLGKRRMREFREAKKKMNEDMRGVKRAAEDMGASGGNVEKRRKETGLLRCAVLNNAREREGGA